MASYVLGAPGSGKSAIRPFLAQLLPEKVVLDWDDLMAPASALAGVDVRTSASMWPAYRELVRVAVETTGPQRCVVLGVCTPEELPGWPIDQWMLLDCDDAERARRLADRPRDVQSAIADAAAYRRLGLLVVETTGRTLAEVAAFIAHRIGRGS